jgi:uncharacterized membrane protein
MFGKLILLKLLFIFGLIIALIHVVLLAITIAVHVMLFVPRLRKAMMKFCPCCKTNKTPLDASTGCC